jgi:hypothetical protein
MIYQNPQIVGESDLSPHGHFSGHQAIRPFLQPSLPSTTMMDICIYIASINSCARRDQSRSTLFNVVGDDENKICFKNCEKNIGHEGYMYNIHDRVATVHVVKQR